MFDFDRSEMFAPVVVVVMFPPTLTELEAPEEVRETDPAEEIAAKVSTEPQSIVTVPEEEIVPEALLEKPPAGHEISSPLEVVTAPWTSTQPLVLVSEADLSALAPVNVFAAGTKI